MLVFSSSFDVGLFAAQIPKPEEQKVIFIYLMMYFLSFQAECNDSVLRPVWMALIKL